MVYPLKIVIFHGYVTNNQMVYIYIYQRPISPLERWSINILSYSQSPIQHLLAGGFSPSEKYDFVSWDDEIPN